MPVHAELIFLFNPFFSSFIKLSEVFKPENNNFTLFTSKLHLEYFQPHIESAVDCVMQSFCIRRET